MRGGILDGDREGKGQKGRQGHGKGREEKKRKGNERERKVWEGTEREERLDRRTKLVWKGKRGAGQEWEREVQEMKYREKIE